ncbi:SagB family peptide dehydrogenase [Saccharothrix sp. NRRL B-16314]|uniref:SagB family peptide dehydrogenase n=1 Tax=Saccharothrix sp. NRRL B-16314 TaxID=1463825 RepID=UPI00068A0FA6|nr:SagB family peptide dehydrogenase [Saccharothrix sp. NRRL B-16314]
MTVDRRYRVRPDVWLTVDADGGHTLVHAGRRAERLGTLRFGELDLLREMAARPVQPPHADRPLVDRLCDGGWLTQHLEIGGRPLVTVEPLGPSRRPRPTPPPEPRLSRFAVLRREGDALVLEAPLCPARVVLHDGAVVALVHHLTVGGAFVADLPAEGVDDLVALLAGYGFLEDDQGVVADQWSPHELWFHSRSRAGHHDLPFGATGWATDHPVLPARREAWPGPAVSLPEPVTSLARPIGVTLDARRSVRRGDDENPLTLAQLGEFLHWSSRVREPLGPDLTRRTSPSGGALHGIGVYPVITRVSGVDPGMYHYDPFGHRLEPVPAPAFAVKHLTAAAVASAQHASTPQVLFVLAARFGRVMRKYQSMAYALVLKDVGALVQTMYLVATAMDLAPCALGAGDAEVFATATGLHPLEEASVGEFILSS